MTKQHFTAAFTVDKTPDETFAAINNVRGWWSGDIEDLTDSLGQWTWKIPLQEHSLQQAENRRNDSGQAVVWLVLDSYLSFIKDKDEWNGTESRSRSSRRATRPKSNSPTSA